MTRYEQGREDVQVQEAEKREARGTLVSVLIVLALFIAGLAAVALLGGCATTAIAVRGQSEIKMHQILEGTVQIAQMGEDCSSDEKALKRDIRKYFLAQGLPEPSILKMMSLPGSSYCGFAQGVADPIGTPELGARNTARARVELYWSGNTEEVAKKVKQAFDGLLIRTLPLRLTKK